MAASGAVELAAACAADAGAVAAAFTALAAEGGGASDDPVGET